jgi:RNA polymerase sigma-70 factor (ECF subfamily)
MTNENQSQRCLVEQAVAGDGAALKTLLLAYHDPLVAHIDQRIPADLRGSLGGEDVCQEAYVAVFQHVASLRAAEVKVFRSFLFNTADNKLRDAIRARRTAKRGAHGRNVAADAAESSVAELLELVGADERTPSRSAARHEMGAQMHAVLDQLPGDQREALRLHYLEGLTVSETAARLARTEGAVLMLCNRALRAAAALLGDPAKFLSHKA